MKKLDLYRRERMYVWINDFILGSLGASELATRYLFLFKNTIAFIQRTFHIRKEKKTE